ncbi:hypothetical protein I317_01421 [Kwoniella heveanensis CBS 569]|nr:hypothetical protein I317_01421 [Kwoniella heveanensis CBS 569]
MSDSIPQRMKALVQNDASWVSIQEVTVPELGDNQVLVKVKYAALNPADWKLAAHMSLPDVIQGADFSGTIVKLGNNLKVPLQVGDNVAGFVHGGNTEDEGAFAQYLKVDSDLLWKVPEGIKMEDAATIGLTWMTASQVIFSSQKHDLPPTKVSSDSWYVVYGASSSVGLFAVNIAKTLGYKVLAFASPHSAELVKSYGADHVVDYHDSDKAVAEAQEITGGGAKLGFDTIAESGTYQVSVRALGKKGKQLNAINQASEGDKKINPNVEIVNTVVYTIFGKEMNFSPRTPEPFIIPAVPEAREFATKIYAATPELITKFGIKPNPVEIRGGLENVEAGLKELQAGKVSGKKLVYKID